MQSSHRKASQSAKESNQPTKVSAVLAREAVVQALGEQKGEQQLFIKLVAAPSEQRGVMQSLCHTGQQKSYAIWFSV